MAASNSKLFLSDLDQSIQFAFGIVFSPKALLLECLFSPWILAQDDSPPVSIVLLCPTLQDHSLTFITLCFFPCSTND